MPPSKTVKTFHHYSVTNSGKHFSPDRALRIAVLITMIAAPFGLAQVPGSVDTNFPAGTRNSGTLNKNGLLVQLDGKVLVVGNFTNASGVFRTNLYRLTSSGQLDTNFSYTAQTLTSGGGLWGSQADGRVIAGPVFIAANSYRILRLNADGGVDTGYTNGFNGSGAGNVGFVQPSDSRVLFGSTYNSINGIPRNEFARLNLDGSVDLGFTDVFAGVNSVGINVNSIAVQTNDNKILIGGAFEKTTSPTRTNLARLNIDGTVDATFTVTIPNIGSSNIRKIVIQPDGKILIAGDFTSVNGVGRTNIARLNANGTLDETFTARVGATTSSVSDMELMDYGQILIGGSFSSVNGVLRTNIARLNPDGSLDTTFSVSCNDRVYEIGVQTNGYVVLGGNFTAVNGIAKSGLARVYAGLNPYDICSPLPVPGGSSVNLNPAGPAVVPANLTYWDAFTKTLYATNPGSVTITWNFTNAPPSSVTSVGYITPIETTVNLGQEIIPPACADTAQAPTGTGVFWHTQTSKLYATNAGTHTIRWKRAGNPLLTIPQQITALWPTNAAQFQIHVAKSAPVDVTGGGSFGSPTLLTQDAGVGATLSGNLFSTTSAGRSLYLVSAPGASAQFTNIYFQFVQSINWNDPGYLRDTNIATIGEAISHPEHNPACGSPYVMDYLTPASPARISVDINFYDRTNRTGPIIPVNRSPSGTRSTDLLLALYQFGSKLTDPLTSNLVANAVAWPYLPVRYLCNWPASPETIFIAGGQGSGPVALGDPNWNVYRQPSTNQLGYNPNDEHAFRFAAAPADVQVKVNFSALAVVAGASVPASVSLVGDPSAAPQNPVTVTVSGARDGDTNLFVQLPINSVNQELVFYPSNWFAPQTISFVANTNLTSGTNSFVVRASGGLVSQTTVEVRGVPTNQLALVLETTALEVAESATNVVRMRLTRNPTNSVTVITSPRGSLDDSADLSVVSGGTLIFNAGNWSIPQSVAIRAIADADNGNDTAVFNVQASGGLTTNLAITATQKDATITADAVYALRNDLGDTNNAIVPKSSEPYVLLKYTNSSGLGRMKVYKVLAEDATHQFVSAQKAGQLLQAPNPLRFLPKCENTVAISGPYFPRQEFRSLGESCRHLKRHSCRDQYHHSLLLQTIPDGFRHGF